MKSLAEQLTKRTTTPVQSKVFMAGLVQRQKTTTKSPSTSERVRRRKRSSRVKELLVMKADVAFVPTVVDNQETQEATSPPHHNAHQDMLLSSGLEDSGYLSLHNSHVSDHCDNESDPIEEQPLDIPLPCSTAPCASPTRLSPSSSPARLSPSSSPARLSPSSSPARLSPSSSPARLSPSSSPARLSPSSSPARLSPSSSPARLSPSSSPARLSPISSPARLSPISSPARMSRRTPCLPILRFQEAVCAELARSYQKDQRYDLSVVGLLAKKHLLDRVIGRQMGRNHVDIFCALLSRNLRGILGRILALLDDLDIIRIVSQTWQKIILEDSIAVGRIQSARQHMDGISPASQVVPGSGLTRDSGLPRVALSCIQTLASSSSSSSLVSRRSSIPLEQDLSSNPTRFNTFLQAARSLQQHEGLVCCRRCSSPARHHAEARRATCTRSSCRFDFCTLCHQAFHGALPCRTLQPPPAPGRTRSKRALHRL